MFNKRPWLGVERRASVRKYQTLVHHIMSVTRSIYWNADTTTIRLIIALSSLIWTFPLLFRHGIEKVPGFEVLFNLASPVQWAVGFMIHFVGISWRFLDPRPRIGWALAINSLGFALWFTSTAAVVYALRSLTPGASLEVVVCMFSAWALYRTGLRDEIVTP